MFRVRYSENRSDLLALAQQNVDSNGVGAVAKVAELDWFSPESSVIKNSSTALSFDLIIGADIVYWEEQDPLMHCLKELMTPSTTFVLAYRNRTELDRQYLDDVILPHFSYSQVRTGRAPNLIFGCQILI